MDQYTAGSLTLRKHRRLEKQCLERCLSIVADGNRRYDGWTTLHNGAIVTSEGLTRGKNRS